jgi:exopolyphosphatase
MATRHLLFVDDVNLEAWNREGGLQVTLVDHNEPAVSQAFLKESVVEIIDHHDDVGQGVVAASQTIAPVGSTATLVAERILTEMPDLIDECLARLLLGPIVLDTVNFDPSAGRCHDKDLQVAGRLRRTVHLFTGRVFDELMTQRADVTGLPTEAFLIRDFKVWLLQDVRIGISSVPIELRSWFRQAPDLPSQIEAFSRDQALDLFLVMAYVPAPVFRRELMGYSSDGDFLDQMLSGCAAPRMNLRPMVDLPPDTADRKRLRCYIQDDILDQMLSGCAAPRMNLRPMVDRPPDTADRKRLRCYIQDDTAMSRKKWMPLLKACVAKR